jgi:hypothetical protein
MLATLGADHSDRDPTTPIFPANNVYTMGRSKLGSLHESCLSGPMVLGWLGQAYTASPSTAVNLQRIYRLLRL